MPEVKSTPKMLSALRFHGVQLEWTDGSAEATGVCPFCTKEGKFYLNIQSGQWDCKVCSSRGNVYSFLRQLWDLSDKATNNYEELSAERNLLHPESLMLWGVAHSLTTGEWLFPGYNPEGKLVQLYRYTTEPKTKKRRLLATAGLDHGLHGLNQWEAKRETVYLCEGPWDAVVLWECLRSAKNGTDGLLNVTGNESVSLLAGANVLAVPGCNVFKEGWCRLFAGKEVVLMYDSDYPRTLTSGTTAEPTGLAGMRKVAEVLSKAEEPPAKISYLRWGPDGYDPNRPSGYDLRDWLGAANTVKERVHLLGQLLEKVVPVPNSWLQGKTKGSRPGTPEVECLGCTNWKDLTNQWRKAMKWIEGLDRTLSVMLACVTSTELVGDQLWIKVVGPPSCGKSVLCEAISVNKKYVTAKSTIRGFHSGFQIDREGKEDSSLLNMVKNKTLVTKDGDTLLQSPNLSQILAEARDIYDRVSRTHYRNRMSKDYEGYSMTWLLCGTESLRELDSSELGERFLDCVIIDDMDRDLERDIALRRIRQAARDMSMISDGKMESRDSPEMVRAKQLTGGYINHLRCHASELIAAVEEPEEALIRCVDLAEFVSFMRARPSKKQEEKAQRELCIRLGSQLVRLAKCLAVVLNKKMLDREVMQRVARVSLDTARGRSMEIVRRLYDAGHEGLSTSVLAIYTNQTEDNERVLLRFLKRIGGVELSSVKKAGTVGKPKWVLTSRLRQLYREVMKDESQS